jgi:hypothetical protein
MTARTRCYLANALYLLGRNEEAKEELQLAFKCHANERLWWDMAEYSLPMTAKLTADPDVAQEALMKAESLHRQMKNPLGQAKTLCLKARRLKDRSVLCEFMRLCAETAALRECPKAARVVNQWEAWVQGPSAGSGPDDYWGL